MKKFKYRESLGEDDIRILELLPGTKDDTIQCYLTSELRQDTINTYDAISYTWGDPSKQVEIICCNEILSIGTNLADALKELRSKISETARRLWVDAICIDQSTSKEKNHQVKRLDEVYQNARQVFAWLGLDDEGIAKDCFSIIEDWNLYLDGQFHIYKNTRNIPRLEPPRHLCIDAEAGSKLRRLMSRPWFQRVWVLQEAGLAKDCCLLWGNHSMSLAELIEFACFCDGRTDIMPLMDGDESIFRFWRLVFLCVYRTYDNAESWRCKKPLIQSLDKKHHGHPGLFLDILHIGRSLSASNPRDYIYAFLGNPLARSSSGRQLLEPDYDKHERDVYIEAAHAFLNSMHESPYVLCFVQHSSADEVTGSTGPSWVPRWKPQTGPTPLYTIGNIGLPFKAGGSADRLQHRVHGRLLSLQGFVFDHLIWISEPLKSENFALNSTQSDAKLRASQQAYIYELWKDVLLAFQQLHGPTKVSESVLFNENFSYTLVTGYQSLHVRHRRIFQAYLQALKNAGNHGEGSKAAPLSEKQVCNASRYEVNTQNCRDRRLALTQNGRFALVPRLSGLGDLCCVFLGMVTPFIIRQAVMENDNKCKHYHLVGEAYIRDVMQGELVDALDRGDIKMKEMILM